MQDFTKIGSSDSEDGGLPQPLTFSHDKFNLKQGPSRVTQVKSELTKHFLEQRFQEVFRETNESKMRHRQFRDRLQKGSYTKKEKKNMETLFAQTESNIKRVKRRPLRADQFSRVRLIGKGAYGDVWVVKDKEENDSVYAMKILQKGELVAKNQILNTLAERDFLTQSNNPWSVQLYYSFADARHLYLVMEFLPGGDLMNLLIKRGILTETETKFFIAETLLAIHHVHLTGFIHRDIKPDNLLLTKTGHIRLTDFGLSTKCDRYSDPVVKLIDELTEAVQQRENNIMISLANSNNENNLDRNENGENDDNNIIKEKKRNREQVCSAVGTPDYIAPEVLLKQPYTQSVDFWSLGSIMYEMLFGSPPFIADTRRGTALKIIKWRETLKFPSVPPVSQDAIDLIQKLLCNVEDRLDFDSIKCHRFFSGIDWANIQNMESPCIPVVSSDADVDTSNFDEFEPRDQQLAEDDNEVDSELAGIAFMGFKYNKRAATMSPEDLHKLEIPAKLKRRKSERFRK